MLVSVLLPQPISILILLYTVLALIGLLLVCACNSETAVASDHPLLGLASNWSPGDLHFDALRAPLFLQSRSLEERDDWGACADICPA